MTRNGWFRMRMIWPVGSTSGPKSVSDTTDAEHRDLGRDLDVLAGEEGAELRRPDRM
jgi:hypothetical protein